MGGEAFASQDPAIGAKGVGGDDVCAGAKVVQMNLAQDIQPGARGERIGRPQRQASVHATAVEFSAGGAIKEKKFRVQDLVSSIEENKNSPTARPFASRQVVLKILFQITYFLMSLRFASAKAFPI